MSSRSITNQSHTDDGQDMTTENELDYGRSECEMRRGISSGRGRRCQHYVPPGLNATLETSREEIRLVKRGVDHDTADAVRSSPQPSPLLSPSQEISFTSGAQRGASQFQVQRLSDRLGDVTSVDDFRAEFGQRYDVMHDGRRDDGGVSCGMSSRTIDVTSCGRQLISSTHGQQINSRNTTNSQLKGESRGSPNERSSRLAPTEVLSYQTNNEVVMNRDEYKRENVSIGCIWSSDMAYDRDVSMLSSSNTQQTSTKMIRNDDNDDENDELLQSVRRSSAPSGETADAAGQQRIATPSSGVSMNRMFNPTVDADQPMVSSLQRSGSTSPSMSLADRRRLMEQLIREELNNGPPTLSRRSITAADAADQRQTVVKTVDVRKSPMMTKNVVNMLSTARKYSPSLNVNVTPISIAGSRERINVAVADRLNSMIEQPDDVQSLIASVESDTEEVDRRIRQCQAALIRLTRSAEHVQQPVVSSRRRHDNETRLTHNDVADRSAQKTRSDERVQLNGDVLTRRQQRQTVSTKSSEDTAQTTCKRAAAQQPQRQKASMISGQNRNIRQQDEYSDSASTSTQYSPLPVRDDVPYPTRLTNECDSEPHTINFNTTQHREERVRSETNVHSDERQLVSLIRDVIRSEKAENQFAVSFQREVAADDVPYSTRPVVGHPAVCVPMRDEMQSTDRRETGTVAQRNDEMTTMYRQRYNEPVTLNEDAVQSTNMISTGHYLQPVGSVMTNTQRTDMQARLASSAWQREEYVEQGSSLTQLPLQNEITRTRCGDPVLVQSPARCDQTRHREEVHSGETSVRSDKQRHVNQNVSWSDQEKRYDDERKLDADANGADRDSSHTHDSTLFRSRGRTHDRHQDHQRQGDVESQKQRQLVDNDDDDYRRRSCSRSQSRTPTYERRSRNRSNSSSNDENPKESSSRNHSAVRGEKNQKSNDDEDSDRRGRSSSRVYSRHRSREKRSEHHSASSSDDGKRGDSRDLRHSVTDIAADQKRNEKSTKHDDGRHRRKSDRSPDRGASRKQRDRSSSVSPGDVKKQRDHGGRKRRDDDEQRGDSDTKKSSKGEKQKQRDTKDSTRQQRRSSQDRDRDSKHRNRPDGGGGDGPSSSGSGDDDEERWSRRRDSSRRSGRSRQSGNGRKPSRRRDGGSSPSPDGSGESRHDEHRNSRKTPGKWMKPDKYDGKGSFETFLYQFENCSMYNGWDKADKVAHLRWSLTGSAAQLLWGTESLDYDQLLEKLRNRFSGKGMEEKFQNELRCRRRARNETLRELSQDVQRLMALAYPGEKSALSEHIARDAFLSAMDDPDLELKVREREPAELDTAVKLAQRFEVFKNTVETSHARNRLNRQVVDQAEERTADEGLEARIGNIFKMVLETDRARTAEPTQSVPEQQRVDIPTNAAASKNGKSRKNRAVNHDDKQWKEDMSKQLQDLQAAQQAADGQAQRLTAENESLNKEVGRLRHLEQIRSVPAWGPTAGAHQVQQATGSPPAAPTNTSNLCFNCSQPGHYSRSCPLPQRPRRNAQWAQQAQQQQQTLPPQQPRSSNEEQVPLQARGATRRNRLSGVHSTYLKAVVGVRECDCLLDTGSEACLLPATVVDLASITRTSHTLKAANGTVIPVLGEITMPMTIGSYQTTVSGLVSEHVGEIMLGIDWLTANDATWDFGKTRIWIGGKCHQLYDVATKSHWCRRVSLKEDVVIPSKSKMNVLTKVICRHWKELQGDVQWSTGPATIIPGVHVSKTLIPADRFINVPVRIVNDLSQPVALAAGTAVADLEPVLFTTVTVMSNDNDKSLATIVEETESPTNDENGEQHSLQKFETDVPTFGGPADRSRSPPSVECETEVKVSGYHVNQHQVTVIADVHREDTRDSDSDSDQTEDSMDELLTANAVFRERNGVITSDVNVLAVKHSDANHDVANVSCGPTPETVLPWSKQGLQREQRNDPDVGFIITKLEENKEKPLWDAVAIQSRDVKTLWNMWPRLAMRDGILKRRFESAGGKSERWQVVWPKSLRSEFLKIAHGGMTGGHLGLRRTSASVQSRAYWPTWSSDLRLFMKQCAPCAQYHRGAVQHQAKLQTPMIGEPWERVSVDITGPHPRSSRSNQFILTLVDHFSKWAEAIPLSNHTAPTVARALMTHVFSRFGAPRQLLTDRGPEFESQLFTQLMQWMDVDKLRTTPYKPSSNAVVERFHRTMNSMLGKVINDNQRDWDDRLPLVLAAYRASPHSSTGFTPNRLFLGRETCMPLDLVMGLNERDENKMRPMCDFVQDVKDRADECYEAAREHLRVAAERRKKAYDIRVKEAEFKRGDWVWYFYPRRYLKRSPKWQKHYTGPYLITRVIPPVNFVLQKSERGKPFVVHTDKLKKCYGPTPASWLSEQLDNATVLPTLPTVYRTNEPGERTITPLVADCPVRVPSDTLTTTNAADVTHVDEDCEISEDEADPDDVTNPSSPISGTNEHERRTITPLVADCPVRVPSDTLITTTAADVTHVDEDCEINAEGKEDQDDVIDDARSHKRTRRPPRHLDDYVCNTRRTWLNTQSRNEFNDDEHNEEQPSKTEEVFSRRTTKNEERRQRRTTTMSSTRCRKHVRYRDICDVTDSRNVTNNNFQDCDFQHEL